ncbi:MAG: ABC transporter substrate-binding protein [Gammaproteobacteria bacterium]|nr:ABC transporter substrate-binding protein [Gammaproteobacteria bacterium]
MLRSILLRGSLRLVTTLAVMTGVLLLPGQPATARDNSKVPRIGFLVLDERHCRNEPFAAGLRELGYVEGKNIVVECHHAGGHDERLPQIAENLARRRPAVIVALNHNWAMAAQHATKDIPLVVISSGDPVASGFAASLARPGGNITGLTYFATELNAKRLEFLKTVVPGLKRVAVLKNPKSDRVLVDGYLRETRAAAQALGLELIIVEATNEPELERAFDRIVQAKAQAVYVLATLIFGEMAQKIADLAMWHNLPTMHFHKHYPAIGGLMSYGPDYDILHRRAATYVDKILKGAKPAELPIEQPARFELTINLATARELGLKVPQSLLLRADKVIE